MRRTVLRAAVVAALLAAGGPAAAVHAPGPTRLDLPPRLIDLLRQEMQAIRAAMHDVFDALIEGDDATAARRAQEIHDSFIFERSLSEADRTALAAGTPMQFRELDNAFHRDAGRLADAARTGNTELAQYFYARLAEHCVACHARFATERFPAFRHAPE